MPSQENFEFQPILNYILGGFALNTCNNYSSCTKCSWQLQVICVSDLVYTGMKQNAFSYIIILLYNQQAKSGWLKLTFLIVEGLNPLLLMLMLNISYNQLCCEQMKNQTVLHICIFHIQFCSAGYRMHIIACQLPNYLFFLQPFSLGVLIAASRVVSLIDDIYLDGSEDRDSYRGTAGWLIFLSGVCLLFQITMVVLRGLYFGQVLKVRFKIFAILVSFT